MFWTWNFYLRFSVRPLNLIGYDYVHLTPIAEKFGFEQTDFKGQKKDAKSLSSEILCDVLKYSFKKEDVREFWE